MHMKFTDQVGSLSNKILIKFEQDCWSIIGENAFLVKMYRKIVRRTQAARNCGSVTCTFLEIARAIRAPKFIDDQQGSKN